MSTEGLSEEAIKAIRENLNDGIASPDIIAIKLGLDVTAVDEVVRAYQTEKVGSMSNLDILKGNLQVLQQLLETAEFMYRAAPNIDNASAVTGLISTSLSTIKEIESRKDPAVVLNEILAKILQPLFRDFIKYVTIESSRARDDLYQAMPREFHARIDHVAKELVKGVGRSGSEDYKRAVTLLTSILGCKPEDERVKPLLRPIAGGAGDEQQKEGSSDSK